MAGIPQPPIVTRSQWGFNGWRQPCQKVPLSVRSEFMIHYDGEVSVKNQTGVKVPRSCHVFHKNGRKWNGIGYHYMIDNNGVIYEGRGFDLQGAHCPNHNRSAWGVQIHIGGKDVPSQAALDACQWLYSWLCYRAGKTLRVLGHKDGRDTSCPGTWLYKWKNNLKPGVVPHSSGGGSQVSNQVKKVDDLTPDQASKLETIYAQTYPVWRGGQYINLNQEIADCKTTALAIETTQIEHTSKIDSIASVLSGLAVKIDQLGARLDHLEQAGLNRVEVSGSVECKPVA